MTKKLERDTAVSLRMKGETIPNIATKLRVSKGTVSLWVKDTILPTHVQKLMEKRATQNRRKGNEVRRETTKNKITKALDTASIFVASKEIDADSALILCSLMYWCEGTKSKNDSEFTFTNAEPLIIKGFLALFRKSFALDEKKFRIKMHLHQYHDETQQRRFWSETSGIPESQFQNVFWKPHTGKSIKKDYPGCIHVRYYDVVVTRRVHAVARAFLEHVA